MGNQLGNILSNFGYYPNEEYLELQIIMLDIKQRVKNIEELNIILNEIEKDDSFIELRKEFKEFKDEFHKELQREKNTKRFQQSKVLAQLKSLIKNG